MRGCHGRSGCRQAIPASSIASCARRSVALSVSGVSVRSSGAAIGATITRRGAQGSRSAHSAQSRTVSIYASMAVHGCQRKPASMSARRSTPLSQPHFTVNPQRVGFERVWVCGSLCMRCPSTLQHFFVPSGEHVVSKRLEGHVGSSTAGATLLACLPACLLASMRAAPSKRSKRERAL